MRYRLKLRAIANLCLQQAKSFSEAYDAREEFRPKAEMAFHDISKFAAPDNRYKPRSTKWEKWRAQYDIHAISLLKVREKEEKKEDDAGVCI